MNAAQAQAAAAAVAAQRNSPMVAAQQLTARSPMPQQQNGQQLGHPQQGYNFAAVGQFNAQMRQGVQQIAHPQLMQHALAAGAANAAAGVGQNGQPVQDQQGTLPRPWLPSTRRLMYTT